MDKGMKTDRFDVENLLNHVLAEKVLSEFQIKNICEKVLIFLINRPKKY